MQPDLGFIAVRPPGLEPGTCGLRAAASQFWLVPVRGEMCALTRENSCFGVSVNTGEYLWITRDHGAVVTTV